MSEQDLLKSGGHGRSSSSAQAGFIPIALDRVPTQALRGIPIYLRTRPDSTPGQGPTPPEAWFRLYRTTEVRLTEDHRQRLLDNGVRFVYIRMADQTRFRKQTEEHLSQSATDPALAVSERSALIYETGVQLVNELLEQPEMLLRSPRLEQLSRATTTLVMNHPGAFSHLLAASHHDFYTATHMVNVATWMVPLAYELGLRDPDELNQVCHAGLLHDIGKIEIPEEVLNKPGKLADDEWALLKRHPVAGFEYLTRVGGISALVLDVTRHHHERLDGSGYPDGLTNGALSLPARICAVVDSFDAMTAFRPFKERTLSVEQALQTLQSETPAKYDPQVVNAWMRLMQGADTRQVLDTKCVAAHAPGDDITRPSNRRLHTRHAFQCPARLHVVERSGEGLEKPAVSAVAHSLSRGGLGLLTQLRVTPGDHVRVYLLAAGWLRRPLDGVIVRCRTHTDSWHDLGVQFTETQGGAFEDAA
ncbi:MAG: HD-GYP domain-containing protein [Phycisphaerales bacterium]